MIVIGAGRRRVGMQGLRVGAGECGVESYRHFVFGTICGLRVRWLREGREERGGRGNTCMGARSA